MTENKKELILKDYMEPIPIFYESVKRTALVIKPKKPFFDWVFNLDNETKEEDIYEENDVYLLPNFDFAKEMEKWLEKNYDDIFRDQMNNWWTGEDLWVPNRTFKMFKEWFDYELHTMIWDTLEDPIRKV